MNVIAVLIATIISYVIGWIWYSPSMFGLHWMKSQGIKAGKKGGMSGVTILAGFLITLVLVVVLDLVLIYSGSATVWDGLFWAGLLWIGFVLTLGFNQVLYMKKSLVSFWIDVSHYLIVMVVSGTILAIWP